MQTREIIELDPLLGDMACHTRAPYLITLAKKQSVLTDDERQYLESCKQLTAIKNSKIDSFDVIVFERAKCSSKQIMNEKVKVASKTIEFLKNKCAGLTIENISGLGLSSMSVSKVKIPILSFYLATKMMLYIAAMETIPIFILLKRIVKQNEEYKLDGTTVMSYQYSYENKQFCQKKITENTIGIVFEMYSCFVAGKESEVGFFLSDVNFNDFVASFSKQDIATLIMILAVGHIQYPAVSNEEKSTMKMCMADVDLDELSEKMGDKLNSFKTDIHSASKEEYNQLAVLARRYGMFRENARYVQTVLNKKADVAEARLFDTPIAITVDHVYCSTLESVQAKSKQLQEKCNEKSVSQAFSIKLGLNT